MKKVLILVLSCMVLSSTLSAQQLTDLDYVSPFSDGVAAVKKGEQWAFINTKGSVVIDFRNDLVIPKDKTYPFFTNGRCLIKKDKEGVPHYGYIDLKGATVIEPEFLNATPFMDNYAIVVKMYKEELGHNDLLDKNMVINRYNEEVIDRMGEGKLHLLGPINYPYPKEKLKKTIQIQSYFVGVNLIAVPQENGRWGLKAIE